MIGLLDASVLIPLIDAAHENHDAAHDWLASNQAKGWATCPLTENACVRIVSQASYPGNITIGDASLRLSSGTASSHHRFWPDSLSILDRATFDHSKVSSAKQLTDLYLLALATKNDGRFVTFDKRIQIGAVVSASTDHLMVLESA